MDKVEAYLIRRIKTLLAEGWDEWSIVQQLEAISGRNLVKRLIEQISRQSQ